MATSDKKYFQCTKQMFESGNPGTNKIRVFFDGLRYVAPNPTLPQVVASIQARYERGYYIQYRDLFISDDVYNCAENWDS